LKPAAVCGKRKTSAENVTPVNLSSLVSVSLPIESDTYSNSRRDRLVSSKLEGLLLALDVQALQRVAVAEGPVAAVVGDAFYSLDAEVTVGVCGVLGDRGFGRLVLTSIPSSPFWFATLPLMRTPTV
jgi:hypothetical protein